MRAWLGWAIVASVVFSLPLVLLLGHKEPSWLPDAWTVAGVPIALVLSLFVFLLATAAGQNLRATSSYRAIVSRTFLIWPVALSVVFLIWCAVIERFANENGSAPPAFANTWLLIVFALQVGGVLLVFARLLSLATPEQVMDVVQSTFADNARRSIAERLRRKHALAALHDSCEHAGMKLSLFGSGLPVSAGRIGWIDDIDLALPASVMEFNATAETSLSVQLGDRSTPDMAIARIDGDVGDWLPRLLRKGVTVRPRPRTASDPSELFAEALDLARRAVAEGIPGSIEGTFDVIGACMGELPASYRIFGLSYTEAATSEGLVPSDEQAIWRALYRFSRDVVASSNDEARRQLPGLALKMAMAGVRQDAPLLLQQGLDLWLAEAAIAEGLGAHDVYQAYARDTPLLARPVMQALQGRLQNESLTLERRLTAVPLLRRLFKFHTLLLKMHVDTGDVGAFRDTWEEMVTWAQHWEPEHDVDELEFALSVTQNDRQRRKLERDLDLAREIAAAKAELVEARDWNMLNLGAWMLQRYQAGELDQAVWEQLLTYVVGVFGSFDDLAAAASELSLGMDRMALLHEWDMSSRLDRVRPGAVVTGGSRSTEMLWLTLLLLRGTPAARVPHLTLAGPAPELVGQELLNAVALVEGGHQRWDVAVGGDAAAKAANLRAGVEAAVAAAKSAGAAQAAAAPIAEERVAHFVGQQERSFGLANRVRELVGRAGGLEIEVSADAFGDLGLGEPLDKRFFVADGLNPPALDLGEYGRDLAAGEQMAAYDQLAAIAAPAPHALDPGASVLAAVADLRSNGFEPDAILVPTGGSHWSVVGSHPEFKPTPLLREHPAEIGTLAGIPVLSVGPEDARGIIVAQVGRAIRLRERRLPGMTSSLLCEVRPITDERASEFIADVEARGMTFGRDAAGLRDGAVEVIVRLDYEVLSGDAGAQAARVSPLPSDVRIVRPPSAV